MFSYDSDIFKYTLYMRNIPTSMYLNVQAHGYIYDNKFLDLRTLRKPQSLKWSGQVGRFTI